MRLLLYSCFLLLSFAASAQVINIPFCPPLRHLKLTSGYGYRIHPITGKWRFHSGIDLSARSDTIFCVLDGVVKQTGYDPILGIYIKVDHGSELLSIYGHLSLPWVSQADTLLAGQPIGITGATGRVTGEHLHFTLHYRGALLNPLAFLKLILRREFLSANLKNQCNE
jgi:murein DD-endopeptidase MepM/ murein hydrolase activator NlpD